MAGKVVLITGGASGIGRATAILSAQEGARVGIVGVDDAEGAKVADLIDNDSSVVMGAPMVIAGGFSGGRRA